MSLNIKALAMTGGVVWGGAFLFLGLANLMVPSYGALALDLGASIYPGYQEPGGLGSVIVVTLYALIDGAVGGAIIAWLYNAFVGQPKAV